MKNKRATISKEVLTRLRGGSPRERLLHRLHSVVLVLNGFSARQVAEVYGDSPRAIAYWVERYKERGVDGLEEEARPGRPSKLNSSETKKLQALILRFRTTSQPLSAQIVSEYIRKKFGIELTDRQCWRILKRLRE